jgi:hypothetical protein
MKIVYEYAEVDVTNKFELREKESAGWEIYGVSRDLRQDHTSYAKLRRLVRSGKEPR